MTTCGGSGIGSPSSDLTALSCTFLFSSYPINNSGDLNDLVVVLVEIRRSTSLLLSRETITGFLACLLLTALVAWRSQLERRLGMRWKTHTLRRLVYSSLERLVITVSCSCLHRPGSQSIDGDIRFRHCALAPWSFSDEIFCLLSCYASRDVMTSTAASMVSLVSVQAYWNVSGRRVLRPESVAA